MTDRQKTIKILKLENRITLMEGRAAKDNGKIIKKCQRQLKSLKGS